MSGRTRILIGVSEATRTSDENLLKLARFQGIQVDVVPMGSGLAPWEGHRPEGKEGPLFFAAGADTLLHLSRDPRRTADAEKRLFAGPAQWLIYGFTPSDEHARLLSWLTGGQVEGVEKVEGHVAVYEISSNFPSICRQMSGLSVRPGPPGDGFVFLQLSDQALDQSLITIRDRSFFLLIDRGPVRMFLVAGEGPVDIEADFDPSRPLEHYFPRLAPFIMFLRHAFQKACWHAPRSFASLIIDDPLLKSRYGCLDYGRLLREMDRHGFYSNIAFIPVNFRRSQKATVELLFRRPDRYALCVHGCEHTRAEFGETRHDVIGGAVARATELMGRHQSITKLPFDKVMVFPQGIFSKEAMRALQRFPYLAAVNTHPLPRNFEGSLRLSDLLEPALMAFENFPLFLRRYPGNLPGLALDLFLGKPALIAVHQDDFREGYDSLGEFVDRVNALDPNLCWDRLAHVVEGTFLVRETARNRIDVRAFADSTTIENLSSSAITYNFSKNEPEASTVERVEFSGRPLPFQVNSGQLLAAIELGPKTAGTFEIVRAKRPTSTITRPSLQHLMGVRARRGLSELRDELVSRHCAAHRFAAWMAQLLRRR